MTILLWAMQILLAAHTAIGAVWKVSNSEQAVPSLSMIPHAGWLGLAVVEVIAAVLLVLPLVAGGTGRWVPLAAGFVALEMLAFVALHFAGGARELASPGYWAGVAVFALLIVWGRIVWPL